MEQKDKLDDLVNKVDQEARNYVSFDDYLASKSSPNTEEQEWKKDATAAADPSSSSSNEPEDGKVESKPPANAGNASPEKEPKEKTWWKEQRQAPKGEPTSDKLRSNPETIWPAAPYVPVETVPLTETTLDLQKVEWNGQISSFLHEEEQVVEIDDEILSVYARGRDFCTATEDIFEVIKHFKDVQHRMKKLKVYSESINNGIRARLSTANVETRSKAFNELNRSNKSVAAKNKPAQEKIKQERAAKANGDPKPTKPKSSPGLKLAETLVAQGMTEAMIVGMLRTNGMLDDVTSAFLQKTFSKGGK